MLTNRPLQTENTELYLKKLVKKIGADTFMGKNTIGGSQILEVTPIKQVNMFIIRALYDRWQKEVNNLRSPYFDYENAEVKVALKEFMNLLSKHISVRQPEFEQLLLTALDQTLQLVFTPALFFQREVETLTRPTVHLAPLKEFGRYLVLNKVLLSDVIEDMESRQLTEMYAGELMRHFHKAIHDNSLRLFQPEELVEQLNAIVPVSISELTGVLVVEKVNEQKKESFFDTVLESAEESKEVEEKLISKPLSDGVMADLAAESADLLDVIKADVPAGLPTEQAEEADFKMPSFKTLHLPVDDDLYNLGDDETEEENLPQSATIVEEEFEAIEEEPVAEIETILNNPVNLVETKAEVNADEVSVAETATIEEPNEEPANNFYVNIPSFGKAQPTESGATQGTEAPLLKDKLQPTENPVKLIDTLRTGAEIPSFGVAATTKPINNLKQNIKFNDRYKFRNQLFGSDDIAWEKALETLDTAKSRREAVDIILQNYAPKYNWDFSNETTTGFMDIINRRFQAD
jgi:hypothetical protein